MTVTLDAIDGHKLTRDFAMTLKDLAYGAEMEGGFSYLVARSYLEGWKRDFITDELKVPAELEEILANTKTPFIIVVLDEELKS